MGEVVQFPGFDERAWRELEPTVKEALVEQGAPSDVADWVCRDLKTRFIAANKDYSLSLDASEKCYKQVFDAANACVKIMHDATSRMLLQMILLELELYFAKQAHDSTPRPQ